ncbi:M23 family metallopeptidase [Anaeroselena agilis]|uniref:M23 family metallopeptidase n=1 Tax=Anaeroselena agilis TaxID=3063788 RepID=A0ABU3P0D0_9FIRM|nr:M23 family metallopeptidase [Selenomonadales bacterium 4137-cl]
MGSREEEYLRRMRALGYQDSLAGMDDDDIEWELSKMEEAERRREAPPQQLRTVYRPVDPGLKARILRQFGQPYAASAIPKGQEFYLNGWDNREGEEKPLQMTPAASLFNPSRGETRRPNEPTNYWDAFFERSRDDGTGSWVNATSGSSGKDSGTNWWVDPKGMFPQYGGDPSGSEARNRYRDNEVVKAQSSGGYMDAGASRNNEARHKFTSDPLAIMEVRGKAKSNTYKPNRTYNIDPNHQGVDLWAKNGTDILAVGDGVIHEKGEVKGYGKYIIVRFDHDGETRYALYAHLSDNGILKDTPVKAGQIIGKSGSSGNAGGDDNPLPDQHLHFELADSPEFGPGMGSGRRDPIPHFRTWMEVDENK